MNSFETSYKTFQSYPTQLVHRGIYHSSLEASKRRLDKASRKLFTAKDADIQVPILDLNPVRTKTNARKDTELRDWLGDQSNIDPQTGALVGDPIFTKTDPKLRFIHFWADDSREPLNLNRKMLTRVLTYHQVMPAYLDFVFLFGKQDRPRDLTYSGFREQTLLSNPPQERVIQALGRSGRQFQLCYNLKAPFFKEDPKEWSIRQAAFHHQFDVVNGNSLWIITKGDKELKDSTERMVGPNGRPEDRNLTTVADCFRLTLAVHLLLANWSTEEWRWYIQSLEDDVDRTTNDAVGAPRGPNHARRKYVPDDALSAQAYADKANKAVMIMEANKNVLDILRQYYLDLLDNRDFPLIADCQENIRTFAAQTNEMIYDLKMEISRANLLVKITGDRITMILQHLQTQSTESMEYMTISMFNIGILSQKEAIAMKIVTVVTLVYLPATFVSTFFSTDVVRYQNQGNNGTEGAPTNGYFSLIALERWLEVTLPLTLVTGVVALYFFWRSLRRMAAKTGTSDVLPLHEKPVWNVLVDVNNPP